MANYDPVFASADHERVLVVTDATSGLRGVIAVHSTALGPAVGGLRIQPYVDMDAAVRDALRLSRTMSFKNALADLGLGGGKAVILDDGDRSSRTARLLSFADAVNSLRGAYMTAEDIGTSPSDMDLIATRSSYVLGLSAASGGLGDPSPTTARSVLAGIRLGVRIKLGAGSLHGVRVGIVGAGKVGASLAVLLAREGAQIVVSDLLGSRATEVADAVGGRSMPTDSLLLETVDVLSPCAGGEMIDSKLARRLHCGVIAGGANNPLADSETGRVLHERNILYVPDFLTNCGGMISIARELRNAGPAFTESALTAASERIRVILEEARDSGRPAFEVAQEQALRIIRVGSHRIAQPTA